MDSSVRRLLASVREGRPLQLSADQRSYLRQLLRSRRGPLLLAAAFIAGSVVLELLLPLLADGLLKYWFSSLRRTYLWMGSAAVVALALLYAFVAYQALTRERTLNVGTQHQLRRDWFAASLSGRTAGIDPHEVAGVLAKVTYHMGLLQMGLRNGLVSALRWFVAMVGLLLIGAVLGMDYLLLVCATLVVGILLGYAAYRYSREYVSSEQTLYGAILQEMTTSMLAKPALAAAGQQAEALLRLEHALDLDLRFRVRRDVRMGYPAVLLFTSMIVLVALAYLLRLYVPVHAEAHSGSPVLWGLMLILSGRALHWAMQAGLYGFPLWLGVILCVPERGGHLQAPLPALERSLVFRSTRLRLPGGRVLKDVNWEFTAGQWVCFKIDDEMQRHWLARLFTAQLPASEGGQLVVIRDGTRLGYNNWSGAPSRRVAIVDSVVLHPSLLGFVVGKLAHQVSAEDSVRVLERFGQMPGLEFLASDPNSLSAALAPDRFSTSQWVRIQIAACMLQQPNLVVIRAHLDEQACALLKQFKSEGGPSVVISFAPEAPHDSVREV